MSIYLTVLGAENITGTIRKSYFLDCVTDKMNKYYYRVLLTMKKK